MSSDTSFLRNSGLDGIININCRFTVTVLISLALNPGNTIRLNSDPSCVLEPSYAQNVVIFHVYSITCFLFSTLIALVTVRISKSPSDHLHLGILVSSVVSACGCELMILAFISVAEMKLGACSFQRSIAAIVPLTLLLPIISLFPALVYAFSRY